MPKVLLVWASRLKRVYRVRAFLVGLLTLGAVLGFLTTLRAFSTELRWDVFLELDNAVRDGFLSYRNQRPEARGLYRQSADEVIVAAIDDDSLARVGTWPWPRGVFAGLLRRLGRAGARTVVLDVLFLECSGAPKEDRLLAEAVLHDPKVLLGMLYTRDADGRLQVLRPFEWVLTPEQLDALGSRLGFVRVEMDGDRVVRSTPIAVPVPGGRPLLSLALLAAARNRSIAPDSLDLTDDELVFGPARVPLDDGRLRINYGMLLYSSAEGSATRFKNLAPYCDTVGVADLLETDDETLRAAVEGKTVLVGFTATSLREFNDIKVTPLGDTAGVYIQADILASLLQDRFIRFLTFYEELALVGCLGILVVIVSLWLSQTRSAILVLALCVAVYFWARWAFVSDGFLLPVVTPWLGILLPSLSVAGYRHRVQERDEAVIRGLFGGYLSPQVVDSLVDLKHRGELGLGGVKLKLTIFYSDIRGFTSLAETLNPPDVVAMLNEYFARMTRIALKYEAYIDKFIGDAMMAVFSAPVPRPDDAVRAVRMAVEMQEEIARIGAERAARGEPVFQVGMGIHTGQVVLGNIGSAAKMDYTVIGDNVNLAARLYGEAGPGQILISGETLAEVEDVVEVRALPPTHVKGKAAPVAIFEILGLRDRAPTDRESTRS